MSCIEYGKVSILGNFAPITKEKPKDYDTEYKVMVPFDFKWRANIGGVECTCTEVLECYMPYYGTDWYHSDECALMKKVKERPQLMNLPCYQHLPLIAST